MENKLRAIFFDAAGTLFAPREPVGESYARLARDYGVDADGGAVNLAFKRAFHSAHGLAFGPGHSAADLRRLERAWWRAIVAATFAGMGTFTDFDAYFDRLYCYFADPANWSADPEAAPLLERLKERGFILGVISNFDYRIYRILDELGLGCYLDSITISSEAGYAKPASELFNAALGRHAVSPSESLHVGDSEIHDLKGAVGVGIAAILVDPNSAEGVAVRGRSARIASLGLVPAAAGELSCGAL